MWMDKMKQMAGWSQIVFATGFTFLDQCIDVSANKAWTLCAHIHHEILFKFTVSLEASLH